MSTRLKILVVIMLSLMPLSTMAWSGIGHKVVAHIAYDYLTPEARKAVDRLTEEPGKYYPGRSRFVYIATWADWSRDRGDARFRLWHYIDLPMSADGVATEMPKAINAVYGINHCQVVLKNARSSFDEQQTCLKLLVHIVGDIHQPLHAVNRFSVRHPRGDRGGNSYLIKSNIASNLHAYWDRGLGEFRPFQKPKPNTGIMIQLFAEGIEKRYPIRNYGHRLNALPIEWAREGRILAESIAYKVPEFSSPSADYIEQGLPIMEERLALAGYRLAGMLNTIYTTRSTALVPIGGKPAAAVS